MRFMCIYSTWNCDHQFSSVDGLFTCWTALNIIILIKCSQSSAQTQTWPFIISFSSMLLSYTTNNKSEPSSVGVFLRWINGTFQFSLQNLQGHSVFGHEHVSSIPMASVTNLQTFFSFVCNVARHRFCWCKTLWLALDHRNVNKNVCKPSRCDNSEKFSVPTKAAHRLIWNDGSRKSRWVRKSSHKCRT